MHYKYCPECGAKLIDRGAGDDGAVPYNCLPITITGRSNKRMTNDSARTI